MWPLWQDFLTDRQPAAPRGRNARGPEVAMCRVSTDVSSQARVDEAQLVTWSPTVSLHPV